MKIAIIGGGITGLTAAYQLSQRKHQIFVFEKNEILGGLAASFIKPNWEWPLEKYFHHFFSSDKDVASLIGELRLKEKLIFVKPKTSIFTNGKILQFDNPKSILLFPYLNFLDKLRTATTSVLLKINPFFKPLEKISSFDFIKKTMGENTFKVIWKPLLVGKFGNLADKIPASWFWTRIKKRSFSLGYLDGGIQTFINALLDQINKNKGKVILNTAVSEIIKKDNFLELKINGKNYPEKFDKVITTVSPEILQNIVPQLTDNEKSSLKSLKSLGNLCLVLELKEKFLTDGTYWLNINEESFPFVAVVEHTNFINSSHYGNSKILYVGGYYPTDHRFFKMSKEQIFKEYLPYLKKINPLFNFELLTLEFKLFSDTYSQPIIPKGYSKILPSIKTSIEGLYWTSLHHVYPQDRGVNYAVLLGTKAVNEITNS